ncbi:hypothetical protein, conserved [Eimeria praecox]|uniref:Uncharacterized protein n=1 Tax=Eimeria praecox TaxID=51316 RepID=U6GST6_9EIME|nr:hypothetical protein, conserved [Eimeria praecox]
MMLMRGQGRHNREILPSSSTGLETVDSDSAQSKAYVSDQPSEDREETEGILGGSTDQPQHSLGSLTQQSQQQQQQSLSANDPSRRSEQEVEDVVQLCLEVIREHEAETASLSPRALQQSVTHANLFPTEASGCHTSSKQTSDSYVDLEEGTGSCPSHHSDKPDPFAVYEAFRPEHAQQLHANNVAGSGEATQDPSVPEQDLDLYATRTLTVLLLAGPSPVRRTAAIASSCFGLHLLSFQVKGTKYVVFTQGLRFGPHLQLIRSPREEELRGFLLFLSLQFLSYQAELPLETLKASIRLVGREDLLQGFNEASLLKAAHFRETSHKLESLGDLLSECESLKYIMIKRRASAAGEEAEVSLRAE